MIMIFKITHDDISETLMFVFVCSSSLTISLIFFVVCHMHGKNLFALIAVTQIQQNKNKNNERVLNQAHAHIIR